MSVQPRSWESERFFYPAKQTKAEKLLTTFAVEKESVYKENKIYVALDLEMSGLNPMQHQIIQIAWIPFKMQGTKLITLPYVYSNVQSNNVSTEILDLTKLNTRDLEKAPSLKKLTKNLSLNGVTFVGHHLISDLRFLLLNIEYKQRNKCYFMDSFYLSNVKLSEGIQNHKLITLEKYFKIDAPLHDSASDALASAIIYYYLSNNISCEEIKPITLMRGNIPNEIIL